MIGTSYVGETYIGGEPSQRPASELIHITANLVQGTVVRGMVSFAATSTNFTPITVTGTYSLVTGGAASGELQFHLTTDLVQKGIGAVTPNPIVAPLNGSGNCSALLIATNDPATLPLNAKYKVLEVIKGAPTNTYYITVPYTAPGRVIDIGYCRQTFAEPPLPPPPFPLTAYLTQNNVVTTADTTTQPELISHVIDHATVTSKVKPGPALTSQLDEDAAVTAADISTAPQTSATFVQNIQVHPALKSKSPLTSHLTENNVITPAISSKAPLASVLAQKDRIHAAITNSSQAQIIMGTAGGGMGVSTAESFLTAMGVTPANGAFMSFDDGGGAWNSGSFSIKTSMVDIANSLASFPGVKIIAVAMYAGTGDLGWSNNTDSAMVTAHTAAAMAAQTAGVEYVRMGWEFQTGTQNWPVQPTAAQFVARFQAIAAIWASAGFTGTFIFNPNNGVATPLNTWADWDPGACCGVIAVDSYFGDQSGVEVPTSAFISGAHPNWNDIIANATANGRTVAIMELGGVGTSDDPTQIDGTMSTFEAAAAANVPVILCVWGDQWPRTTGTWGMQCSPNMWAELQTDVAAGISSGVIA